MLLLHCHFETNKKNNMETSQKIQILKKFILGYAFSYSWNAASRKELANEAETVIDLVAISGLGFASEIAATVAKYKKISEKQAYWIAKAAVENNHDTRVAHFYEAI